MGQANVSSCVLSILATFTNAIDVLRKSTGTVRSRKRHGKAGKGRRKADLKEDGEARLLGSLRQGPVSIENEYQRSLQAVGERFVAGDGKMCSVVV
jgi:hypothetical protein